MHLWRMRGRGAVAVCRCGVWQRMQLWRAAWRGSSDMQVCLLREPDRGVALGVTGWLQDLDSVVKECAEGEAARQVRAVLGTSAV
jgi:hypothetical protein